MKTFIVEELLPIPGAPSGGELIEAWTMKGARRKFRKYLATSGVSSPELLAVVVMEVELDAGLGEVLAIPNAEIG